MAESFSAHLKTPLQSQNFRGQNYLENIDDELRFNIFPGESIQGVSHFMLAHL